MAKVPANPDLPKQHPNLDISQEDSERALLQAEAELREHYEMGATEAPEISLLRSGVREDVARALVRNMPIPGPFTGTGHLRNRAGQPETQGEQYMGRVKEEKLTAELYRAVSGNEISETERVGNLFNQDPGEDPRHYRRSAGVEHMQSAWYERGFNHVTKMARAVVSKVGVNTYIEARVAERFGAGREPQQRRAFVGNRLEEPLNVLDGAVAGAIDAIAAEYGLPVPATVDEVQEALQNSTLTRLRRVRDVLTAGGLPRNPDAVAFLTSPAFSDLMMLVDLDQRTSADFGIAAVYDHVPLRRFWGNLPAPLQQTVLGALDENAMFPLENEPGKNNPDSIALMSVLRARVYENIQTGRSADEVAAITDIQAEIADIVANESPNVPLANEELRNRINALVEELRTSHGALVSSFASLTQFANDVAALVALIPTLAGNAQRAARERLVTLQERQNAAIANHVGQEQTYKRVAGNLIIALRRASRTAVIPPELITARDVDLTPEAVLSGGAAGDFFDHITNDVVAVNTFLDDGIPNNFLSLPGRMPPFVLMQRLMRRDYMRRQNPPLDPAIYNEEANHYANVKAALIVEDVKSVNRKRSANQRAAQLVDRSIFGRGSLHMRLLDKLKYGVAKGQDFIGLEPINFKEVTADKLLEQIVNSEEEFTVFRGINKFTTTRDLRNIINKTGRDRQVSRETLERFSQVLEEAISRFKRVRPSLEKGLDPDDWDLENLVDVFKKIKVEMWSREMLVQLHNENAPGQREQNLVRMLRGARDQERQIQTAIEEDVKDPDAMWRVYLAKNELKRVLDKEQLDAANSIRAEKIKLKRSKIARKQAERDRLPEGDPGRARLDAEIAGLERTIVFAETQTERATDLYTRVEEAKAYIDEHNLNRPWNRRERREYLDSVGLRTVFDKMSTNHRLQRSWGYTKSAARATWSGTKKIWAWSRKNFINRETAGKTYEIGRWLASPAIAVIGAPLKVIGWSGGLVGRAISRGTDMPKRLLGTVSHNTLRSYYRGRLDKLVSKIHKVDAKTRKQNEKLGRTRYSFTKKRIAKYINKLEEEKYSYQRQVADYLQAAAQRNVPLGDVAIYTEAIADIGTVEMQSTGGSA